MNTAIGQSQYQVRFDWGIRGRRPSPATPTWSWWSTCSRSRRRRARGDAGCRGRALRAPATPSRSRIHTARRSPGARDSGPGLSPASITAESLRRASGDSCFRRSTARDWSPRHRAALPCSSPGSLRNARAVARWALEQQGDKGDRFVVAVIAAGEEREDGSMRFALEDLLGAGAIVDALADVGIDYCSPEAAAAASAFTGLRNATGHLIGASASGRELVGARIPRRHRSRDRGQRVRHRSGFPGIRLPGRALTRVCPQKPGATRWRT